MAQEYNLAVQRGDGPPGQQRDAAVIGQWLSNRFSR